MNTDRIEERAAELFDQGYYCAESVLLAVAEALGHDSALLPAVATGFCSGMARTAGPCGALSGAIMALGLESGRSASGQCVEDNYRMVRQLIETFEQRFGSSNCGDLLDCHLGTAAGQERFREQQLGARCRGYTRGAAGIAAAILSEALADEGAGGAATVDAS